MKSMLFNLWNGNLCPVNNLNDVPEIKELELLIASNQEKLSASFDKKQTDIFECYNMCIEEYLTHISEESFELGISIGIKIITEALY